MSETSELPQSIFVLTLPLHVTEGQAAVLNKRYEHCRQVFNRLQNKMMCMYTYVEQTKAWKGCVKTKDGKTFPDIAARRKFMNNYTIICKNGQGKNRAIKPFTEFGIRSYVAVFNKTYKDCGINSYILQGIANNAWSAWEKFLYGNGKRISFKRKDECNSYSVSIASSGGFIGFDISELESCNRIGINLNGKRGKNAKMMYLRLDVKTDYERECIANCELREITIKRNFVRGQWKYFIGLTLKGAKPSKNRKLGQGRVGIDLGTSSVAVSSDEVVFIDDLAKGVEDIEKKKNILQRQIDRSRRAMNPEQFNEDGTIRRYKRGTRPAWIQSKRCKKKREELKELYRKQTVRRKESHIRLSNMLLSLGNDFIIENNPISAWSRRAKETTINKKGKINPKKRHGKSIANHAPAMFATILENKVKSLGGSFTKLPIRNAATQFDFTNQSFTPHKESERRITLSNGVTHLRDVISAYNIQHLLGNNKEYDVEAMVAKYDRFCRLEQEEIQRHLDSGEKLNPSFGIKKN